MLMNICVVDSCAGCICKKKLLNPSPNHEEEKMPLFKKKGIGRFLLHSP